MSTDWGSEQAGGWEKATVFKVIEKLPQGKDLVDVFKKQVPFGRAEFIADKKNTYGVLGEVGEKGKSSVMELSIQTESNSPLGKVASLRVFENKEKYQEAIKQEKEGK